MTQIVTKLVLCFWLFTLPAWAGTDFTLEGLTDFEFVEVPPGTFWMGGFKEDLERYQDQHRHLVTLTRPFEIQTTEVSQELWERVMFYNPSIRPVGPRRPVTSMTWDDISRFLALLNRSEEVQRSGYWYRLPTEAEWEYSARGAYANWGVMGAQWAYGDKNREMEDGKTHPLGLYNIYGGVREYVEDAYQRYLPAETGIAIDPRYDIGNFRVIRGEDSAHRASYPAYQGTDNLGFRLARERRDVRSLSPRDYNEPWLKQLENEGSGNRQVKVTIHHPDSQPSWVMVERVREFLRTEAKDRYASIRVNQR